MSPQSSSTTAEQPKNESISPTPIDDDEPDDWDKRIFSTGCYRTDENMKLTDCYYETKDWRACKEEMKVFKECWKRHGNTDRTSTQDRSQSQQ